MRNSFSCNRVVVRASAKVNLSLDITGRRDDGYHLLEMVMLAVSASDVLIVSCAKGDNLRITCSQPDVPVGEDNIVSQAAVRFFEAVGLPFQGLHIHIDKHIPMEAGLAGGSADAAAVLMGLNRLFGAGFTKERLREIGLHSGADVPFSLTGGLAFVRGIGEQIEPLPELPECHLVLAKPKAGMSTGAAFKRYDSQPLIVSRPDTEAMLAAVRARNLAKVGANMFNVFEQIVDIPEIGAIRETMLCGGAVGAAMTGSGTAVTGLFLTEKEAGQVCRDLWEQAVFVHMVRPVWSGPRILYAD